MFFVKYDNINNIIRIVRAPRFTVNIACIICVFSFIFFSTTHNTIIQIITPIIRRFFFVFPFIFSNNVSLIALINVISFFHLMILNIFRIKKQHIA